MDGVVAAVQVVAPAGQHQARTRLQALRTGVVGQLCAAAAARLHSTAPADDGQCRLGLDAILPRRQIQDGIGDNDIAQGAVVGVGGAQRVPAALHPQGGILDSTAILACDAVILGRHGQVGGLYRQGILACDAVIIVAPHRQRAAACDDQIAFGVKAGVGFLLGGGRVAVTKGITPTIGQGIFAALCQIHGNPGGFVPVQRAAVGAGDIGVLQHQNHLLPGGVHDNAPLGGGAGDHIGPPGGDGDGAACYFGSGALGGGGCPRKGDDGGSCGFGGRGLTARQLLGAGPGAFRRGRVAAGGKAPRQKHRTQHHRQRTNGMFHSGLPPLGFMALSYGGKLKAA